MIAQNLPALQVVMPLLGAPLCALLGRGGPAWALTTAIFWAAFAVSAALLARVLESGPIDYAFGGWPPPWGIAYRVDALSGFVLLFVSGVAAIAMPFAYRSVRAEIPGDRLHLFYTAVLLTVAGLLGMTITNDAFNAFVFMEISSLSAYVLIALGRDRRALLASYRYLVLGTIGATFFVFGVGMLYMATGTLNMSDLAARIPPLGGNLTVLAGFAFLMTGLSLKVALFPLHAWLPDAYTHAPSFVSALLAATATKVAVYLMLRFMFGVFGAEFSAGDYPVVDIVLPLAAAAAVVGSLAAIRQTDVKRLLAWSSVAQIVYMGIGVGLANAAGLTAAIVHLFNHALMKGAMFLAVGCVVLRLGGAGFDAVKGLGRRMPLTFAAFVVGGLSLIGVPGTVGFVGKWYLMVGAIEQGLWPVAALVAATSLLAAVYVWRVVEAAYFAEPAAAGAGAEPAEAPWPMVASCWALAAACVAFGLTTDLTIGVAGRAAAALLGAGP